MDNINKIYSITPPGLMRPDRDDDITSDGNMPQNNPGNNSTADNCIDNMPLAMAYVPMQRWQKIYEDSKAIMRGTIFEELDLPFKGAGRR